MYISGPELVYLRVLALSNHTANNLYRKLVAVFPSAEEWLYM